MKPGTIVTQKYITLDGEQSSGLFVIIYDESLDYGIIHNHNVVGLKITSTPRELHYNVSIKKRFNPFLDHDSYVMCSKPHVLVKNNLKVIGELNPSDLLKVMINYTNFNTQISLQLFSTMFNLLKRYDILELKEVNEKND